MCQNCILILLQVRNTVVGLALQQKQVDLKSILARKYITTSTTQKNI